MTYRLAMLDIDGTLQHKGEWFPSTPALLRTLRDAEVEIALCSGRAVGSMLTLAQKITDATWIAANSGATVLRRCGEEWATVAHRSVPVESLNASLAHADAHGIEVWGHTASEWLIRERTPLADEEQAFVGDDYVVAEIAGRADVGKLLFRPRTDEDMRTIRELAALPGVAVVTSGISDGYGYADVIPAVAPIAKGGDVIVDALGISWDSVIAMGDGENDLGMLTHAGFAVGLPPLTRGLLPEVVEKRRAIAQGSAHALEIVQKALH